MRRVSALAVAGLVAAGAIAVAQQLPLKRPVLHEDLPAPSGEIPSPMIGASGSGGNPAAFAAGDKVLPRPTLDKPDSAKPGEPVLGKGGFAADRQTEMKPDEKTTADDTLHYVSVFNPDVLPFKRMSAFEGVADDYTLKIDHTALAQLPVGGTTDKSRDRFWGSVMLQLTPGTDVALPSVAPDMRILSYEIKPAVHLAFEKDGADNFYVRSDDASATVSYRLVFLADADAGYFAPSLPTTRHYTPAVVARITPAELRPVLPAGIRAAARRTLDKLGVDADMELGVSFNKLVAYFRAFSAKPAPPSSGDIYRDLCDSQAGVCRHRAFAFMITANALGIPTRYVQNEAHAFVEVWFPEKRWQRIDLGGAAARLEISGAENKTLHRPRAEDPFAKPTEYKETYSQLDGDIKGLSQQQLDDKKKPLDQAPASGDFGGSGKGSGNGTGDHIIPDQSLPAVTQDPKKPIPHLVVTTADASAYRGDVVHVEGRVEANGRNLPDRAVDVFLAPSGKNGSDAVELGRATTGPDGTFHIDLTVPSTLGLATYEIFLSSPEDAYYNAALSD
jgi:hypothetical protein